MRLDIPLIVIIITLLPLIFVPGPDIYADTMKIRWLLLLCSSTLALLLIAVFRLVRYNVFLIPLFLFIVFVFLSSIYSEYPSIVWIGQPPHAMTGFFSYLSFIVLFCLAFGTASHHPQKVPKIIDYWLASVCIIAFIGLLQYFGFNQKSYSTILNSNDFGSYMAMAFPFAAFRLLQDPKNRWSVVIFVIIYAALLTSLCRGALIGLLFALPLIYFYYPDRIKKNLLTMTALIFLVTVIVMPFNDWRLVKQVGSLPNEMEMMLAGNLDAGSKRLLIWQEALKTLPYSPLLGTGPDTLLHGRFFDGPTQAHNIYIEIGVTMGIPALFSYLGFLGCCVLSLNRKNALQFTFFVLIIMYLVQGVFLNDVLSVYPILWILLGLGAGLAGSKTNRLSSSPQLPLPPKA